MSERASGRKAVRAEERIDAEDEEQMENEKLVEEEQTEGEKPEEQERAEGEEPGAIQGGGGAKEVQGGRRRRRGGGCGVSATQGCRVLGRWRSTT